MNAGPVLPDPHDLSDDAIPVVLELLLAAQRELLANRSPDTSVTVTEGIHFTSLVVHLVSEWILAELGRRSELEIGNIIATLPDDARLLTVEDVPPGDYDDR